MQLLAWTRSQTDITEDHHSCFLGVCADEGGSLQMPAGQHCAAPAQRSRQGLRYLLEWHMSNSVSTFFELPRLKLAQIWMSTHFVETHHGRQFRRLIMTNFSSFLGKRRREKVLPKCWYLASAPLFHQTPRDATFDFLYCTLPCKANHFLFKQCKVGGLFCKEYLCKEIVLKYNQVSSHKY